jgi:hypothetical protein
MFRNNARTFFKPIDLKRCQEYSPKILENN